MSAANDYEEFALIDMPVNHNLSLNACRLLAPMLNKCLHDEFAEVAHADLYVDGDEAAHIKIHINSFKYAMRNGAKISQFSRQYLDDILLLIADVTAHNATSKFN